MAKDFSLEAIFRAKDRLSAPIAKMKTKLGAFASSAAKFNRKASGLVDKGFAGLGGAANAFGVAGVFSIAGVGYAIKDVMETGVEFEKTMIRASNALEKPAAVGSEAFKKMGEEVRKVSLTTEHSQSQAANAFETLTTAGYKQEQALGALSKIADFASAGNLEMGAAAEVAAATLGAFNLTSADAATNTKNMARATDVLVRASADSSASVEEMFEAIKAGGPAATSVGARMEDFGAAANVLADSGIKGSQAGTALKNVFIRLAKQTPVAAKTMKKYGLEVAKNKDGSIDMAATVEKFNEKLGKLSPTQRAAALDTIFGSEAMGAFTSLMAAGPKKIKGFTESLENAEGTTAKMAESVRNSSGAKLQKFFNKLNDLKLTVFEKLAPIIEDIVGKISKWVEENDKLIKEEVAAFFTKLKDNLPTIAKWAERLAKGIAAFVAAALLIKTIEFAILVIKGFGAAYTFAAKKMIPFVAMHWATIGLYVLIAAAAIALVLVIIKYWPQITQVASDVWESVSGFFQRLWEDIEIKAYAMAGAFLKAWDGVKAFFSDLWEGIKSSFFAVLDPVLSAINWITGKGGKAASRAAPTATRPAAPQVVPLQGRAAASDMIESRSETNVDGTITVEAKPGTSAEVRGKSKKVPLVLHPSGAF